MYVEYERNYNNLQSKFYSIMNQVPFDVFFALFSVRYTQVHRLIIVIKG